MFLLLLLTALAGAQAGAAVAQPAPDAHPSATKAPSPDPAPDAAPTRTAPARATPDAAAPLTPPTSSSSFEPRVAAPAPTPPPTFTPPRVTTISTAEQKERAARPGRQREAVAAVGTQNRERVPLAATVTDPANGRKLLLGGLGLLALALASGSLLFFVTRTGPQEAHL